MSSFKERLIQKIFKRERYVRTHVRSAKGGALDQYDKMKKEAQLADRSNRVERLVRKVKRRLDRAFGQAVEAKLPELTSRKKVNVARVAYGPNSTNPSGFAIQLTFPNNKIIEREGYLPGDIAILLNGLLKGQNLAVVNVPDATHLLLQDSDKESTPASKASFTGQVAGMTTNVTITAVTPGTAGNSIVLSYDGSTSVSAEIAAWNLAHPSNQASLTSGNGAQIPNNATSMTLSGGTNEVELSESNITARINVNGVKRSYR